MTFEPVRRCLPSPTRKRPITADALDAAIVTGPTMLSSAAARRAAALLTQRLGEIAVAAAVFRAQEAAQRDEFIEMVNWHRIAERLAPPRGLEMSNPPSGQLLR